MKSLIIFFTLVLFTQLSGCSQKNNPANKKVGGGCEGCEAIYETPVPFEKLKATDTLPDFNEQGRKIVISGIVYELDGKTPAKDVIVYVYHTDQAGRYSTKGGETGWGKRHGYIRGWVKTDKNGFYQFYTLRPAAYPDHRNPEHIHVTVKEPNTNEYWIDEYLFNDDPLLTQEQRRNAENRGGDGIITLVLQNDGLYHATRNIILGKNVPGYR